MYADSYTASSLAEAIPDLLTATSHVTLHVKVCNFQASLQKRM
jgi:hypothetical protein